MPLTLSPDYIPGLDREWHRLRSPGGWWSGAERVEIAAVARAARREHDPPATSLPAAAVEAATRLSADPHATDVWIAELDAQGLSALAYVEILGVVARLNAIDTFLFGIGQAEQPLPDPLPGRPSGETVPDARLNGGLVPTVGPASPPNGLSAVPGEAEALLDLHGVLYLSLSEMGDLHIDKDLSRAQLEFVAARTSLLNDCFF